MMPNRNNSAFSVLSENNLVNHNGFIQPSLKDSVIRSGVIRPKHFLCLNITIFEVLLFRSRTIKLKAHSQPLIVHKTTSVCFKCSISGIVGSTFSPSGMRGLRINKMVEVFRLDDAVNELPSFARQTQTEDGSFLYLIWGETKQNIFF